MDLRKIKKLIELVEESGIAELEVKSGEEAVRITMAPAEHAHGQAQAAVVPVPLSAGTVGPQPDSGDAAANVGVPNSAVRAAPSGEPLNAPLSGTFYIAPTPDAAAFVAEGDRVSVGDVLCIVESMKMMNRIEADRAGIVNAVLVPNGEPVEAGQPLFLIGSGQK